MSSVTNPRGKLPARVYWVRRGLVLAVALLLVFGIGKLLGGVGGSDEPPKATKAAASAKPSKSAFIGPVAPSAAPEVGARPADRDHGHAGVPLAAPNGPCLANEITTVPQIVKAAAGRRNVINLSLTSTSPACTFPVSAKTLVVKISSGKDRIWSTQDCLRAIKPGTVVVRVLSPDGRPGHLERPPLGLRAAPTRPNGRSPATTTPSRPSSAPSPARPSSASASRPAR